MHESELFFHEGLDACLRTSLLLTGLQLMNPEEKYRGPELVSGTSQHGRVREVSTTASVKIILHSGI